MQLAIHWSEKVDNIFLYPLIQLLPVHVRNHYLIRWCNRWTKYYNRHSTKKPVTTMLTYPWKCTVLHCNHLGNTWKPLVLMTRHFDYCPSASEGDNQSVRSSAPVVSRCFPGGYNVKLYISRGRLARWLLAFLHSRIKYALYLPTEAYVLEKWFTWLKSFSMSVWICMMYCWEISISNKKERVGCRGNMKGILNVNIHISHERDPILVLTS